MRESDQAYYKRRATEERLAAEKAAHPLARRAHLDLAARHDEAVARLAEPLVFPRLAVAR